MDVAVVVGVTPQAVSFWETGERSPRPEHLDAYVDVLRELKKAVAVAA